MSDYFMGGFDCCSFCDDMRTFHRQDATCAFEDEDSNHNPMIDWGNVCPEMCCDCCAGKDICGVSDEDKNYDPYAEEEE